MATSTIKRNGLGAPTTIDLNSNWTAPSDGIVNVYIGWNVTSNGYMYIKDTTADSWVCAISDRGDLGGYSSSAMFPVVKGHQYTIGMSSNVGEITSTFYPL